MQLRLDIFPIYPEDFPRVVEVWEASVRATHHFVREADIHFFKPLVRDALPHMPALACVRDGSHQVAGFIAVAESKVEMLFIHPSARGQGAGSTLLTYAVTTLGATILDVNEQNEQAVGFYRHMGFEVVGRSAHDGTGKPYPLLHLRRTGLRAELPSVPTEITAQVSQACAVIERHLASTLQAIHLYGSAIDGGLKPYSDIDVLVTVSARPNESIRQALLLDLLTVSARPGEDKALRALEVTVIAHNEVVPWRYPARRELQFGEWLRKDLLAGMFEPAVLDIDLAILLTKARQHSTALVGPAADELFEPVPEHDFFNVLADTLKQWNSHADWVGDERNVVLTLARMWYSTATGSIAPKDVAAEWVLERLPVEHQPLLYEARQAYLGHREDHLAARADQTAAFILFSKSAIIDLLGTRKT